MKVRHTTTLVVCVLYVDLLVKTLLPIRPELIHHVSISQQVAAALVALVVCIWGCKRIPQARAGFALVIAGALGNSISALNGGVPDPFVILFHGSFIAFNVADMAVALGVIAIAWAAVRDSVRFVLATR